MWVEQVNRDGDRFPEVTPHVLNHLAGQGIALVGRFADSFDRAVIRRQTALVALLKQVANPLFDGGIGRDGLQTAEVAAVAALAQRIDLNVANFADVAVPANKNAPVRDDARAGTAVHAHQDGVFAVLTCTEIVLGQRQAADVVPDIAGDVEAFFQRSDQAPVFHRNMRHIADHAAFRVDEAWQDHRDGDQLANFALTVFDKGGDDIQQGVFQRFLGALGQGKMFLFQGLAA